MREESYRYPGSTHVPLEAHAALAVPSGEGRLTVWSSTQNPHAMHRTLARLLGLRPVEELHEREPTGAARLPIDREHHLRGRSHGAEVGPKFCFGGLVRQIADKQTDSQSTLS